MTMNHLGLASVNNSSRFLKSIAYEQENRPQPCFIFQLSLTSFGGLNVLKMQKITGERL